jgi:hypothetical protein
MKALLLGIIALLKQFSNHGERSNESHPISGVPFRTFDSLPLQWAVNHPVFSIPYHTLVVLLEDIRKQEEDMLVNWNKDTSDLKKEASAAAGVKRFNQCC